MGPKKTVAMGGADPATLMGRPIMIWAGMGEMGGMMVMIQRAFRNTAKSSQRQEIVPCQEVQKAFLSVTSER